MSMLPVVASTSSLVVQQQKELTEVFTSLETKNRYAVSSPDGRTMFYAAEQGGGVGAFLTRNFLNTSRPFHIAILDPSGRSVMDLHRPFRWLFARLDVVDGDGQAIGAIERRFSLIHKRFSIYDASGAEVAQLIGPLLRPWTFKVIVGGQEVGRITKQWGGLVREAFTDADTFGVEFGPSMSPQLRALVFGATFLIDFLYFEHRQN